MLSRDDKRHIHSGSDTIEILLKYVHLFSKQYVCYYLFLVLLVEQRRNKVSRQALINHAFSIIPNGRTSRITITTTYVLVVHTISFHFY